MLALVVIKWWDEAHAIYAHCVDIAREIGSVRFQHCPRANGAPHETARYYILKMWLVIGLTNPLYFCFLIS